MKSCVRALVLSLSCVIPLQGCGDPDASPDLASQGVVPICGEGGVGFAAHRGASLCCGQIDPASLVLFELGTFAAVDPSCDFVVTDSAVNDLGIALGGRLTSDQANELASLLSLGDLDDTQPRYALGDGRFSESRFAWGDRRIEVTYSNASQLPDELSDELNRRLSDLLMLLTRWGNPVDGPVRYVVAGGSDPRPGSSGADGPTWPLDAPLGLLSLPEFDSDDTFLSLGDPRIWVASGEEAAALKIFRSSWLEDNQRLNLFDSIEVTEPDGRRFFIYMRDVIGYEANLRPIVPWATEGNLTVEAVADSSISDIELELACASSDTMTVDMVLESVFDNGTSRWGGRVEDLPAGDCSLRLNPTDPGGAPRCVRVGLETESTTVAIPQGWSTSQSFRCRSN